MTIRLGRSKRRTYSAAGAVSGFDGSIDLDYDTNDPQLPEPFMGRVRTAAGVLTKAVWLNESLLLRLWAIRKDEPCLKAHAHTNASTKAVIQVRGKWDDGAPIRYGINGQGNPLLGANEIEGVNVFKTTTGAALPAGLPPCLVVRT